MEKEGLIRALSFIQQQGLFVGVIVTDRHAQIAKWLRENLPTADHRFDVWHLAKGQYYTVDSAADISHYLCLCSGFRKKVQKLTKEKDCELIGEWEKSLVNHLYWCASSTPSGNGEEIRAKWLSLDNHIHNKHSGHSKLFKKCQHGRLTGHAKKKKWFKRRKLKISLLYYNMLRAYDTRHQTK